MITQNQIKRTLSTPANIETIRQLLEDKTVLHRTDLATRVCKQFAFYDARGQTQVSSCAKALRQLEQAGHIILPGVQRKRARKLPRRLQEPVSLPVDVPHEVGDVQDLRLVMVRTDEEKRIWNELMLREHPLGDGPLVDRVGQRTTASALASSDRDESFSDPAECGLPQSGIESFKYEPGSSGG